MQDDYSIEWENWDGRLYHVTSVLNRTSIEQHGLDSARMGAAPGAAGAKTPELEGVFVGRLHEASFFVGFRANPLVDVWLIEGIDWTELVFGVETFWHYPGRIPREKLTLLYRDLPSGRRGKVLSMIVHAIDSIGTDQPIRVGIDGPPASGKTTLAEELAAILRSQGRSVIRISIEDFLLPREIRYRRGELNPESNYYDSFDFDGIRRELLDQPLPGDAVLIFEGVFLFRPELDDCWNLRIHVFASADVLIARAQVRDQKLHGSVDAVEERFRLRYLPAQELYAEKCKPVGRAHIVIRNDEPDSPGWSMHWPGAR